MLTSHQPQWQLAFTVHRAYFSRTSLHHTQKRNKNFKNGDRCFRPSPSGGPPTSLLGLLLADPASRVWGVLSARPPSPLPSAFLFSALSPCLGFSIGSLFHSTLHGTSTNFGPLGPPLLVVHSTHLALASSTAALSSTNWPTTVVQHHLLLFPFPLLFFLRFLFFIFFLSRFTSHLPLYASLQQERCDSPSAFLFFAR